MNWKRIHPAMATAASSRADRAAAPVHFDVAVGPVGAAGRDALVPRHCPTPVVASRVMIGLLVCLAGLISAIAAPKPPWPPFVTGGRFWAGHRFTSEWPGAARAACRRSAAWGA